jgi:hypothetical protein
MNGFLMAMTLGTAEEKAWGTFGGPRAFTQWVQAEPAQLALGPTPKGSSSTTNAVKFDIPARPAQARDGSAFMRAIEDLPLREREEAIYQEITSGNVPEFLRKFCPLTIAAVGHKAVVEVAPDYLAVGSDADFVRVPMTPITAQRIAERFGCRLTTKKLTDEIYKAAEVKLEPKPMSEKREAVATFVEQNTIIEQQRAGKTLGLLVAGIKKDIVVSNRLREKPSRVAIYGWHQLNGKAIQPLTIVHGESYVDYSHGVRLVKREMLVDGKKLDASEVIRDSQLCWLLSDEGPIDVEYPVKFAATKP